MKNEWQALKAQKEKELPIAQAEREEFLKKHVDKFEKQVLKKARKQEAGTSVVYGYRRNFLWFILSELVLCEIAINDTVEITLKRRLESYGIDAELDFQGVRITLP